MLSQILTKYGLPKENSILYRPDSGPLTTLMIRNIPYDFSLDDVVREFDESGFGDRYDLLYLPYAKRKAQNRGYAYVNFKKPISAAQFKSAFHKQQFRLTNTLGQEKRLNISPACVQGFSESFRVAASKGLGHDQNGLYIPI